MNSLRRGGDAENFRQGTLDGFSAGSSPGLSTLQDNSQSDPPYGYGLFLALISAAIIQQQLHRSGQAVLQRLRVPLNGAQEAARLHSTVLNLNESLDSGGPPSALTIAAIHAALDHLALPQVPMRLVRARGFAKQALTLRLDQPSRDRFITLRRLVSSRLRRNGILLASNGDPHVTSHYAPAMGIGDLNIPAIDWNPDRLVLILSHRGRHQHDRLGEWPLK